MQQWYINDITELGQLLEETSEKENIDSDKDRKREDAVRARAEEEA